MGSIYEKKQWSKISCYCPFNGTTSPEFYSWIFVSYHPLSGPWVTAKTFFGIAHSLNKLFLQNISKLNRCSCCHVWIVHKGASSKYDFRKEFKVFVDYPALPGTMWSSPSLYADPSGRIALLCIITETLPEAKVNIIEIFKCLCSVPPRNFVLIFLESLSSVEYAHVIC